MVFVGEKILMPVLFTDRLLSFFFNAAHGKMLHSVWLAHPG